MRGETFGSQDGIARTISTPLPSVPERLIQRRPDVEELAPKRQLQNIIVEHLFGENHDLSEEEIVRCAFVYAKGYKEGVESLSEEGEA